MNMKHLDKKPDNYKPLIGLLVVFLLSGAAFSYFLCKGGVDEIAQELEQYDPGKIVDERSEKIESFKKLLELDPDDLNSHHELGKLYNEIQEYKNALRHLRRADKLSQEKPNIGNQKKYDILSDLAHSLSKMNRFDDAIKVLERAKRIDPKRVKAYNKKGNIHDARKEYKKARKEYLTAKKVDKKDSQSYKNLADQDFRKNKKRSALELLKEAVRNNPHSFKAFENLGDGYGRLGQHNKAISSYSRALALKPPKKDAARIHYKIAKAHKKLGDLSAYEKSLRNGDAVGSTYPRISEELGDLEHGRGNLKDALSHYKKALSRDSKNKGLRDKYAQAYAEYRRQLEQNKGKGAVAGKSLDGGGGLTGTGTSGALPSDALDPDDPSRKYSPPLQIEGLDVSDLIAEGKKTFKNKQYALAGRSFGEAQSKNPKHPRVDYLLARAQDKLNKDNDAIKNYNKALKKDPKDKKSLYHLGLVYYRQKRYLEALDMFNRAIKVAPDFVNAHYSKGLCYDKMNKNSQAIRAYESALRIEPKLYQAHFNLGVSYKKSKKYTLALRSLNNAVGINPDDANIYYQRGEIYASKKELRQALSQYQIAIQKDPKHYEARFNSALLYSQLGQKPKAKTSLEDLREEYPKDAQIIYQLGKIAEEADQLSQAASYYETAIETDPKYYKAYLNLGEVYTRQKKDLEAKDSYRSALELKPSAFEPSYNLGNLHFRKKEYGDAKRYYEKALTVRPNHIKTRLTYAETLEGLNLWKDAEKQYIIILKKQPRHLTAMERLAFLYYRKLNSKREARNTFEKIVNNYPEHPQRSEYEKLIQILSK